ncbi:MAG TPA: fused MFS/spermidine synthase [Anaeromyxobacteraceae bacterium]|nr:fused MFS/spermidine synthase [Anaeromyxobacteraceae bacterium]
MDERRTSSAAPAGEVVTSRAGLGFLMATSFVCGAMVMVVEVLGSRVIGPYFGVSLFVWTALITVTLVGLAAGYAVGGWLSDRRPSADWLYGLISLAGACVLAIPYVKSPILQASLALGLRGGSLAAAAAIFFPSLFLLGCVSPYIVKIAAREIRSIGRVVGALYAISTLGSFLGTVLTGFVLIAAFGVGRIFQVVGVLLLGLGGTYFAVFRRRLWLVAPALLALLLPQQVGLRSGITANGTLVQEIHKSDGFYGHLDVVDLHARGSTTRAIIVDGAFQGGMDLATGLSAFPYPYFLQFLPYALQPSGKRCLVVGLGAGVVPTWYERMGVRTDVVEIDPEVLELARRHFGFRVSGRTVVDDARHFLNVNDQQYDFVVLDAFSGDTFPGHLLTREALSLVARAMTPGGVLALNLVGGLGRGDRIVPSVVRTLATLFDRVEVRPIFDPQRHAFGNVEIAAYWGPARNLPEALLRGLPVVPGAQWAMSYLWGSYPVPRENGVVLTDDFDPMETWDLEIKEALRRRLAESRAEWDLSAGAL